MEEEEEFRAEASDGAGDGGDDSSSFNSEEDDRFFGYEPIYPRPDVECWDPEDEKTYEHFKDKENKFYAYHDRTYHHHGCIILEWTPVFELYSITIDKLGPKQQDFSLVYMRSHTSDELPMIIYKKPTDKNIGSDEILPLKGPIRPPTLYKDVVISFNRRDDWMFDLDMSYFCNFYNVDGTDKFDYVVTESCMDDYNTSEATIVYRVISSGARVELSFTFVEEEGRNVYLTAGSIIAFDVDDCGEEKEDTRRIVQEYPKNEAVSVPSYEVLEVNRSQFGVPLDSCLGVSVDVTYVVDGYPDEEKKMKGRLDLKVPNIITSRVLATPPAAGSNTILLVQALWTTPIADLPR